MKQMVSILVTCGGAAGDIKGQLGSRAKMKKVRPGAPIGTYGDYIFDAPADAANSMKRKYPNVVTIL